MFIKKTRSKNNNKTYLSIVENIWVNKSSKAKTIESIGYLEDLIIENPNIMDDLKKRVEEMNSLNRVEVNLRVNNKDELEDDILNYGFKIIQDIFNKLSIKEFVNKKSNEKFKNKYDLGSILEYLVIRRIISPDSILNAYDNKDGFFMLNNDFKIHDLYRSLSKLYEITDELQVHIHQEISKLLNGRDIYLVFYDVTNYYFQINLEDEDNIDSKTGELINEALRKYGFSKENRHKPIVTMGLFMDMNGIPLAYQIFSGNTSDCKTFPILLRKIKDDFKINKIIVVADKAMNSNSNINHLIEQNDAYIFSQKVKGASKKIKDEILNKNAIWNNVGNDGFKYRSWVHERMIKLEDNSFKKIKEKIIVYWSKNYYERTKHILNEVKEELKEYEINKKPDIKSYYDNQKFLDEKIIDTNSHKEIEHAAKDYVVNWDSFKKEEELSGYYCIVSSDLNTDDLTIINSYHHLNEIEQCFKVTKSELNARPVFVWTYKNIQGHFLVCFISLVILRLIKHLLLVKNNYNISTERIIKVIQSCSVSPLTNETYKLLTSHSHKNKEFYTDRIEIGKLWNFGENLNKSRLVLTYSQLRKELKKINLSI